MLFFLDFVRVNLRVQQLRFLAFPGGPGGFREVREADRNHFHLSWYLIVPGITSYCQNPSWGDFFYRPRYILGLLLNTVAKKCGEHILAKNLVWRLKGLLRRYRRKKNIRFGG